MEISDTIIDNFQAVTGLGREEAKFFLEAANGNFDTALMMAQESFPDVRAPRGAAEDRNPSPVPPQAAGPPRRDPPPLPPVQGTGLMDTVLQVPVFVLSLSFGLVRGVLGVGVGLLGFLGQHVLVRFLPASWTRSFQRNAQAAARQLLNAAGNEDPTEQARALVQRFEARYGTRHPHFQECGLREAMNRAQREARFLLVYLQGPQGSPEEDRYCRETLCQPALVEHVNANFLVWAGQAKGSSDAAQLARTLGPVRKFPCTALFWPAPEGLTLLVTVLGAVEADRLIAELGQASEDHAHLLEGARAQRRQLDESRRLREAQDSAYQASLAADRERVANEEASARRAREEAEAAQRREEEARRLEEEAERRRREDHEALERRRASKAQGLGAEPPSDHPSGTCAIRVRLPDGSHHARRFLKTDALERVYDYVDSLPTIALRSYHLVSSFPRKVFSDDLRNQTLEEAGLFPQAALFVQSNDD